MPSQNLSTLAGTHLKFLAKNNFRQHLGLNTFVPLPEAIGGSSQNQKSCRTTLKQSTGDRSMSTTQCFPSTEGCSVSASPNDVLGFYCPSSKIPDVNSSNPPPRFSPSLVSLTLYTLCHIGTWAWLHPSTVHEKITSIKKTKQYPTINTPKPSNKQGRVSICKKNFLQKICS